VRVRIVTLGCRVNQVESQALARQFAAAGFSVVPGGAADVVIVNSCTVTAEADRKTRQAIRRLRREHPDALLVLTGCLPQAAPEAAQALPEADLVTGTRDRAALVSLVRKSLADRVRRVSVEPYGGDEAFETALEADGFDARFQKAYLKVEDGCDRFCAYCVIPRARGRVRSLLPAEITRRAAALAANGYREIVLTGINLSRYGVDCGLSLADAVEAADAAAGDFRLRLSSLESDLLSLEQWERLARCGRLCPQFHLALQSGCDETLARMRRRYTTAQYRAATETARALFPGAQITTDLIAGFPGETEAEFAQTCAFVDSLGLLRAHVFVYSPRPGTAAASLPGRVPAAAARARSRRLAEIVRESAGRIAQAHIGRTVQVLCEADGAGFAENGLEVRLPAGARVGEIETLRIVAAEGERAVGAWETKSPPERRF